MCHTVTPDLLFLALLVRVRTTMCFIETPHRTPRQREAVGLGETLNDIHKLRMNMMTTNYSDESCNLSLDFWIPSKIIASKVNNLAKDANLTTVFFPKR